jgi:hypothetical protein
VDIEFLLEHMPPDRAASVRKWLTSELCTCRVCGEPVRPVDPRAVDPEATTDDHEQGPCVLHLACRDLGLDETQ